MPRWTFFAFDWERFRAIEPELKRSSESADFSELALDGVEETLADFTAENTAEEVASAIIVEQCGLGEALVIESGLAEMVHWLRHQRDGEEAAEILGELIAGEPSVAGWFRSPDGIAGLLGAERVSELAIELARFRAAYRPRAKNPLAAFTRRLASTDPAIDRLDPLIALVSACSERSHGLAVLREE